MASRVRKDAQRLQHGALHMPERQLDVSIGCEQSEVYTLLSHVNLHALLGQLLATPVGRWNCCETLHPRQKCLLASYPLR
eukprot:5830470-Amphidinium_carterae.1